MPATASYIDTQAFRSWFNDTRYLLLDKIDAAMKDPIFDLLGEIKDPSKSDTISVTGRDNTRTAKTKAESAKIVPEAAVEEDQLSKGYVTFAAQQRFTWESIVHNQYGYSDEDPTELVDNVFRGISRLLHAQLFNKATSTSVTMPGTHGSYALTLPNGQSLFSASQSGPGYSSKTNIGGTGALSIPNLTSNIQVGISNFVTSTGERREYRPNAIIIPMQAEMREKGKQVTGSSQVESTGNNAINVYSGGAMKLIELCYAPENPDSGHAYNTSLQYNWMTVDLEALKKSVQYKFISRPTVLPLYQDPETGDYILNVMARVAVVAKRWQFGVLNNSTTAPTTSA